MSFMVIRLTVICLLFLGFSPIMISGEVACPLNCNDLVHISLGSGCTRVLTAYDVMNGDTSCMDDLVVDIEYYGSSIGNEVGANHIGKTLKYRIIDPINNNNSCWGELLISKKSKPIVDLDTLFVDCLEAIPSPNGMKDSCGFTLTAQILSSNYTELSCSGTGTLVGRIHRTILVFDAWRNSTQVTQVINLTKSDLTGIHCPHYKTFECCTPVNGKSIWDTKYSDIDQHGFAHPKPILDDNGNSVGLVDPPYRMVGGKKMYLWDFKGKCKIAIHYKDHIIDHCGWSYTIKRHWFVEDWCSGEEWECYQDITIEDRKGPEVEHLNDITLSSSDYDCNAHYIAKRPKLIKECGLEGAYNDLAHFHKKIKVHFHIEDHGGYGGYKTIKKGELEYLEEIKVALNPGTYHVKYEFWDACENYGYATQKVTVKESSYPIPSCISSKVIDMKDECSHRVYAKDMDKGSHHSCCGSVHVAIAHKDSMDYYHDYWHNHYKKEMSSSQYNSSKYQINQEVEEWINTFVFNDHVDLSGCGKEQIVFRVYETCEMKSYENWFPGNKHQWYCYQTVKNYDCYFVSHYPYLKNSENHHYAPMTGTSSPKIDYCHKYNNSTYNWLSSQGISSSQISALRKVEQNAPSNYHDSKHDDCTIQMTKKKDANLSCTSGEDLYIYCDGTPKSGEIKVAGLSYMFTSATSASDLDCHNPSGSWTGPDNSAYGNYSNINNPSTECDQNLFGIESLGLDEGWRPLYCRAWLLMDEFEESVDYETMFSEVESYSGCSNNTIDSKILEDLDACGSGTITKTWTMKDDCGNQKSCSQIINVSHRSDFEVLFPEDVHLDEEMFGSVELDQPKISDSDCEKMDVSFKDEVIDSSSAGYTIIRSWSIINSCLDQAVNGSDIIIDDMLIAGEERPCVVRYLKDNGDGHMAYLQVITISSSLDVSLICIEDQTFCTDSNCVANVELMDIAQLSDSIGDVNINSISCRIDDQLIEGPNIVESFEIGTYSVIVSATLSSGEILNCQFDIIVTSCNDIQVICTEDLSFCNASDCGSDSLDVEIGKAISSCDEEAIFDFQYIVKPFDNNDQTTWVLGSGNRLQGIWPVGTHGLILIATNNTGSLDSCETSFTIEDCGDLRIEFLSDTNYCNSPGSCISDTVDLGWTITRTCSSDSVQHANLSYLFVIKPNGTDDHNEWILQSNKEYRGVLPVGTHTLEMMVIDPQGPSDTMVMEITVSDCELPSIMCVDSIIYFEIEDSSGAVLTVEDFNIMAFDNCPEENLTLSFSADSLIEELKINCTDLTETEDTIYQEIWVTDQFGNQDHCETAYILKDDIGNDCNLNLALLNDDPMLNDFGTKQHSLNNNTIAGLNQMTSQLLDYYKDFGVVSIKPNPFSTQITLITNQKSPETITLEIYNLNGQSIFSQSKDIPVGQHEWTIPGSEFPESGIYVCAFKSKLGVTTKRLTYIQN